MDNTLKKQICDSLKNPQDKNKKYSIKDIKTGNPKKDCKCYVISIIDNYPHIYYGKYEAGKFYKASFTSSRAYRHDTDFRQQIFYKEVTPDAYVLYK